MVDAVFSEQRLAEIYDPLDADRSDLDVYTAMAEEFGAGSVLDVGCGTGTLACRLALRGLEVIAVDPAAASLDVARRKPGAATGTPRARARAKILHHRSPHRREYRDLPARRHNTGDRPTTLGTAPRNPTGPSTHPDAAHATPPRAPRIHQGPRHYARGTGVLTQSISVEFRR